MKKILITGGAGFLGSHLCSSLVNEGNDVICMDNLFTSSIKNIEHLFSKKNFQFIRQDITFPVYLEVDEIYNLACPASPLHYQKDPIQTMKVNVIGSINMLGLAKRTNAKIFQSSTSEIYGNPNTKSQDENYFGNVNPIGIRSCYDEGKRAAESLFFDYHRMQSKNLEDYVNIDAGEISFNFLNRDGLLPEYLLIDSYTISKVLNEGTKKYDGKVTGLWEEFLEKVDQNFHIVKEFRHLDGELFGPTITIYKVIN